MRAVIPRTLVDHLVLRALDNEDAGPFASIADAFEGLDDRLGWWKDCTPRRVLRALTPQAISDHGARDIGRRMRRRSIVDVVMDTELSPELVLDAMRDGRFMRRASALDIAPPERVQLHALRDRLNHLDRVVDLDRMALEAEFVFAREVAGDFDLPFRSSELAREEELPFRYIVQYAAWRLEPSLWCVQWVAVDKSYSAETDLPWFHRSVGFTSLRRTAGLTRIRGNLEVEVTARATREVLAKLAPGHVEAAEELERSFRGWIDRGLGVGYTYYTAWFLRQVQAAAQERSRGGL